MSYTRMGSVFRFVYGKSNDYVFPTSDPKHRYVEDWGKIEDRTLVEFVCRAVEDCPDRLFAGYVREKVAERLGVRLRKKPLTEKQALKRYLREVGVK